MTSARENLAIRYSLFAIRRAGSEQLLQTWHRASLLFGSHLHRCNRQFPVMTSVAHSLLQIALVQIEYDKLQIKQLIILE